MWWSTLSPPLHLNDGRSVETLADARGLILSLPPADQAQDRWQRAAAMLMTAAETGRRDHISIAEAQLERALTDPTQSWVTLAEMVYKKPAAPSVRRRPNAGAKKRRHANQ